MTVQKSVNVSTISAGHLLPKKSTNSDAIYAEVATYLNKASNVVLGQPGTVTAAQLHDNNVANGEVTFEDDLTMTVVAPHAHVDYGLANVIGFDSVEVNAAATVQVRTPILPSTRCCRCGCRHMRLRTSGQRRRCETGARRRARRTR